MTWEETDLFVTADKILNLEDMMWYAGSKVELTEGIFVVHEDNPLYAEIKQHQQTREQIIKQRGLFEYEIPEILKTGPNTHELHLQYFAAHKKPIELDENGNPKETYLQKSRKLNSIIGRQGSNPHIYKYNGHYYWGQNSLAAALGTQQAKITQLVKKGQVKKISHGTEEYKNVVANEHIVARVQGQLYRKKIDNQEDTES